MAEVFIPKNSEGRRISYNGIENLVRIEEDLHIYLARPEVNLAHILNIHNALDLQPVEPSDEYARRINPEVTPPLRGDDRRISEYEKKMESWSKDCAKVLAIVKSIYSPAIINELKTVLTPSKYNNGTRENIQRVMNRVRTRYGGYSVAKSSMSRDAFGAIPKIMSPSSVAPTLIEMRYEIEQREQWSDLANNVDHRFTEAEKKSRLVSLMDSWDELKFIHNRLRSTHAQAQMTYDEIVTQLLDAILPLQEDELIERKKSVMIDRNQGQTSTSMSAYANPTVKEARVKDKRSTGDLCYNCGSTGHRSYACEETMCNWCDTVWSSVKAKGYHHNTECPQKGKAAIKRSGGAFSRQQILCTNCQGFGHNRSDCRKPICSACGTIWMSKQNPGYHHCDNCPHPTKQSSHLGKRRNPYETSESRAHMTMMKQCLMKKIRRMLDSRETLLIGQMKIKMIHSRGSVRICDNQRIWCGNKLV
mgnify:CR=1 FL=1